MLIAVMLGRLRMGIDDAIKQYWTMSNSIFRPRLLHVHCDAKGLQESIKTVVRNFCGSRARGQVCTAQGPTELLRQRDYAEEGDAAADNCLNHTCKVYAYPTLEPLGSVCP
jgi:hypothetical protein